MSSLSNLPYGQILDYWYEKLKGKPYRTKFLMTKFIEVLTFKSNSKPRVTPEPAKPFPNPIKNSVPEKPSIAIVVPVYAKKKSDLKCLRALIDSILSQTLHADHVFFIDDASPLEFMIPEEIESLRLAQNRGPAHARNLGKQLARRAGAEIIAFTDSDCILDPNWLASIVNGFQNNQFANVLSGKTVSFNRCWLGKYHDINGTLNGRKFKNQDRLLYGTTANLAITSLVADTIDFNERFPGAAGEDIEFCYRCNNSGFSIFFHNTMIATHDFGYNANPMRNITRFVKQFRKYGQGEKILLSVAPNYYDLFNKSLEISNVDNN